MKKEANGTIWLDSSDDSGDIPGLPADTLDDMIAKGRIRVNKATREVYIR